VLIGAWSVAILLAPARLAERLVSIAYTRGAAFATTRTINRQAAQTRSDRKVNGRWTERGQPAA
jgi:hypothetical protein